VIVVTVVIVAVTIEVLSAEPGIVVILHSSMKS
jgi:hypothetical protein